MGLQHATCWQLHVTPPLWKLVSVQSVQRVAVSQACKDGVFGANDALHFLDRRLPPHRQRNAGNNFGSIAAASVWDCAAKNISRKSGVAISAATTFCGFLPSVRSTHCIAERSVFKIYRPKIVAALFWNFCTINKHPGFILRFDFDDC